MGAGCLRARVSAEVPHCGPRLGGPDRCGGNLGDPRGGTGVSPGGQVTVPAQRILPEVLWGGHAAQLPNDPWPHSRGMREAWRRRQVSPWEAGGVCI